MWGITNVWWAYERDHSGEHCGEQNRRVAVVSALRRVFAAGTLTSLVCWTAATGVARAETLIYWSDSSGNKTSFTTLDGSSSDALMPTEATVAGPEGVVIQPEANRIFWANRAANRISAFRPGEVSGSDLPTVGATVDEPVGLAIEFRERVPFPGAWKAATLYWTNRAANKISWASLDGGGAGDLNTEGATVNKPFGVAVDATGRKIYWANSGGPSGGSISFAPLDGSGGGNLPTGGATLSAPAGVALDIAAGRIYWANSAATGKSPAYTLSFANLDGSGGGDLALGPGGAVVNRPVGVALDPSTSRIYWVDEAPGGIYFAGLAAGSHGGQINAPGAKGATPAFLALLQAPIATPAALPEIYWGGMGTEPSPPVGKGVGCKPGGWEEDLPGGFLFRAPAFPESGQLSYQLDGIEIPGTRRQVRESHRDAYYPVVPGTYTCSVTVSNQAGSTTATSRPVQVVATPTVPRLTRLSESNRVFAPAGSSTPLTATTARRVKRGTTFSFALDQVSTVVVRIQRAAVGRRFQRVCEPYTRRLRHRPSCARFSTVATLTRSAHMGPNRLPFTGRIRGRALRPGHYRALFFAVNAAGHANGQALYFTVL
jgi:DNA-binding beta-propeller fold protein YncE